MDRPNMRKITSGCTFHSKGWMCKVCELYPYSTGPSMGAFSTRSCDNTSHPSHSFKQHKSSTWHKRLEKKLTDNSDSVYEQLVLGVEKIVTGQAFMPTQEKKNLYKKIPSYCTCVNASIQ